MNAANWYSIGHSPWANASSVRLPTCCCEQTSSKFDDNNHACFTNSANAFTANCYDKYIWPQLGQPIHDYIIATIVTSFAPVAILVLTYKVSVYWEFSKNFASEYSRSRKKSPSKLPEFLNIFSAILKIEFTWRTSPIMQKQSRCNFKKKWVTNNLRKWWIYLFSDFFIFSRILKFCRVCGILNFFGLLNKSLWVANKFWFLQVAAVFVWFAVKIGIESTLLALKPHSLVLRSQGQCQSSNAYADAMWRWSTMY